MKTGDISRPFFAITSILIDSASRHPEPFTIDVVQKKTPGALCRSRGQKTIVTRVQT